MQIAVLYQDRGTKNIKAPRAATFLPFPVGASGVTMCPFVLPYGIWMSEILYILAWAKIYNFLKDQLPFKIVILNVPRVPLHQNTNGSNSLAQVWILLVEINFSEKKQEIFQKCKTHLNLTE